MTRISTGMGQVLGSHLRYRWDGLRWFRCLVFVGAASVGFSCSTAATNGVLLPAPESTKSIEFDPPSSSSPRAGEELLGYSASFSSEDRQFFLVSRRLPDVAVSVDRSGTVIDQPGLNGIVQLRASCANGLATVTFVYENVWSVAVQSLMYLETAATGECNLSDDTVSTLVRAVDSLRRADP